MHKNLLIISLFATMVGIVGCSKQEETPTVPSTSDTLRVQQGKTAPATSVVKVVPLAQKTQATPTSSDRIQPVPAQVTQPNVQPTVQTQAGSMPTNNVAPAMVTVSGETGTGNSTTVNTTGNIPQPAAAPTASTDASAMPTTAVMTSTPTQQATEQAQGAAQQAYEEMQVEPMPAQVQVEEQKNQ